MISVAYLLKKKRKEKNDSHLVSTPFLGSPLPYFSREVYLLSWLPFTLDWSYQRQSPLPPGAWSVFMNMSSVPDFASLGLSVAFSPPFHLKHALIAPLKPCNPRFHPESPATPLLGRTADRPLRVAFRPQGASGSEGGRTLTLITALTPLHGVYESFFRCQPPAQPLTFQPQPLCQ